MKINFIKGMFSYYARLFIGWSRHIHGFCPSCNSDAPYIDTCKVCLDTRTEDYPPSKAIKQERWKRFKDEINRTH